VFPLCPLRPCNLPCICLYLSVVCTLFLALAFFRVAFSYCSYCCCPGPSFFVGRPIGLSSPPFCMYHRAELHPPPFCLSVLNGATPSFSLFFHLLFFPRLNRRRLSPLAALFLPQTKLRRFFLFFYFPSSILSAPYTALPNPLPAAFLLSAILFQRLARVFLLCLFSHFSFFSV